MPEGQRVTADTWERIREAWQAAVTEFDSLGEKTFVPAKGENMPTLKEQTVSIGLVSVLLRALGWTESNPCQFFAEQVIRLRVGSKELEVLPDYVLASSAEDAGKPGRALAVVEVKRELAKKDDSASVSDAQAQARIYAEHLKVPVYAVIDKRSIRVWQRFLLSEDQLVLTLEVGELGVNGKTQQLEELIGRERLEFTAGKWRGQEATTKKPVHVASPMQPDPDDYAYVKVDFQADPPRMLATTKHWSRLLDPIWWFGTHAPATTNGAGRKLILRGNLPFNHDRGVKTEPLVALVHRLRRHAAISTFCVDEPDRWNRWYPLHALLIKSDPGALNRPTVATAPNEGEQHLADRNLEPKPVTEWVDSLNDSLDDWVVKALRNDLHSFIVSEAELDYAGALTHMAREVRQKLALTLPQELRLITRETLLASFRPPERSLPAPYADVLSRVHLGPMCRLECFEGSLLAVILSNVFADLHIDPGAAGTFPARNLHVGYPAQSGLFFSGEKADMCYSLDKSTADDAWSAHALLALRSSAAFIDTMNTRRRSLDTPQLTAIAERHRQPIGRRARPGLVFMLQDAIRQNIERGASWDDLEQAVVDMWLEPLTRPVSRVHHAGAAK
jgi:hypothetical protein